MSCTNSLNIMDVLMYCNWHSTVKHSTLWCSAEMKMKWEVCNSLKHNTAKSGFARVNSKIKFTSEERKAVPLTTYSSAQALFIFSKDQTLQGNLLTKRITTLIWSLCEQPVERRPVYLLKGANKKLYWGNESLIWVLKLYAQRCLPKSLIA